MKNLAQGLKQSGMVSTNVGFVDVNKGLINMLSNEFQVPEIQESESCFSVFSQSFPLTDIETVLPRFPLYDFASLENTDRWLSVDADMS